MSNRYRSECLCYLVTRDFQWYFLGLQLLTHIRGGRHWCRFPLRTWWTFFSIRPGRTWRSRSSRQTIGSCSPISSGDPRDACLTCWALRSCRPWSSSYTSWTLRPLRSSSAFRTLWRRSSLIISLTYLQLSYFAGDFLWKLLDFN